MHPRVRAHGNARSIAAILLTAVPVMAHAAEQHGRIAVNGVPLPGVTVTATQGGKSLIVLTDTQGLYQFPSLDAGEWHLRFAMQGFRPVETVVTVPETTAAPAVELQMLALADLLATAKAMPPSAPATPAETAAKKPVTDAAETPAPPPESPNEAERGADGMLINGSSNNAATSKYSLSQAFGSRRAGSKALYTGSVGFQLSASPFDARPYSITGLQVPKASYTQFTGLATLGGPIRIPHLFYNGPNFFLGYQWTRDSDAETLSGLVPTAAERSGDLGSGARVPVVPQAAALLALYPLPNLAGSTGYNYQTQVLNGSHVDALQSRLDKGIGRRDQVYGKFGFRNVRSDTQNLFHFRDGVRTLGIDSDVNWSHRFPHQVIVESTYRFSRLRTQVAPFFANRTNVSGNAGIGGNLQDPGNWGPPDLNFSSIASLTDGISTFDRNRTDGFGVNATWTHRRHTVTFGGDFRRQEFNQLQQANPRGTFTFTSTAASRDLANFLAGRPDASKLAFGNADKYFRQSVSDLFVTDDWRVRPELTLTTGLRWDYGAPITELKGRLVNLDAAPGFTAVAPVLGYSPQGALTGIKYPSSLVRPDFLKVEPRIGFAWRPLPTTPLVIRGGYGVYADTSVYLSAAASMAQQSPLSKSVSVANSASCPLTLADGFRDCAGTTADVFGIDPNFRVGYVQTWRISVQRDLPGALVLTADYLGAKGTRGPQEFLPNTYAPGSPASATAAPRGFLYRTSNGNSIRHAGGVELRRRLRSGLTATLSYVWSHSIDNDAYLGGGASTTYTSALTPYNTPADTIAQNWLDLRAERSRSSFDQRNLLKLNVQYTSGTGMGGGTLLAGWRGRLLKQWTIASQLSAGSGLPQTPVYLTTVPGTGFTGTVRPDRTNADVYAAGNGYHLNGAAYAAPVAGQWGRAGRYSIEGPNAVTLDSSLARVFKLRDPLSLDVRVDGTNVLNHVVYTGWNTVTNSTTFGLPAASRQMRSFQLSGRLRF